ncbi:MAG: sugar phosphate isomerase/epimerase family protein [Anaerolineae bacterium]
MDINRISCCSIAFHGQAPERVFEAVAAAGYKKIDLLARMPHFDLSNPEYDFAKVVGLADRFGLRIANIGSYCGGDFASDDAAKRDAAVADTKATIDAAVFCGARSIRTRPGYPEDPALLDRLVPCYRQAAEYAEAKGIYMGIENHGGAISGKPEVCAELFRRVGSKHAGVLYEPCNLMMAGVEYRRALDVMRDCITHVHIKDCYEIDGKMSTVWIGTGGIDFRWVLDELDAIGYDGDYALEYEMDVEPADTAVGKWLDWFTKL